MPNDDLMRILNEIVRAQWDPTAPLPSIWPSGVFGVFLFFCVPLAGGIPFGVIMARDSGISPLATAGLYLLSDVVLAITAEPMLALLRWVAGRVEFVARIGTILGRLTDTAGLKEGGVRGPLGLILVSFSISPTTGRAATAAAGHGFFSGWTLAIIGDMLYFGLLMATTLWISSIFGDDRLTIGAVVIATWVIPLVIRRVRKRGQAPLRPAPRAAPVRVATVPTASLAGDAVPASTPRSPRKQTTHTGRRRPSRGLHR